MEKSLKEIIDGLLKKDKNILSIFMHGSSTRLKLEDYSDIDLVVLYNKNPPMSFYVKTIEINNKKILVSFSYRKYGPNLNPLLLPITELAFILESLRNSKVLWDKKDYYDNFKKSFKKSDLRNKQKSTFSFYFNVLIDNYYKTLRLYKRRDYRGLRLCAKHTADKSLKLINYFNKIIINKNLYNNPKDLKRKPKDYDKYFYIVSGLENPRDIEELYLDSIKLINSTLLFIYKQNLSQIKEKQFVELLNNVLRDIKSLNFP